MKYLKTKSEARNYRYGCWSGMPLGTPYDDERCAMEISSGWLYKQCTRNPVAGKIYCKQHQKKIQQTRHNTGEAIRSSDMSIVSIEDAKEMSDERKKEYCRWCFHKSYGDCEKCALFKHAATPAKE
jgi:hypothetical protein